VLKFKLPHASPKRKSRHASSGADERWVYKGYLDLVDVEVVVSRSMEPGEERRFELLSPQQSFAIYSANEEERDEWSTAIRNAKASLLVSLNVMQPNSTLTSSSSTNHLRRTLQALPYAPEENGQRPQRGKVDHFVPAIWIPDGKTQSCMRCGRTFGWRRRRHHCRLCGRCVCGSCSSKTFWVLGDSSKESQKPARACDACYDTVFPVLESPQDGSAPTGTTHSHLTLSGLKSMPSLLISDKPSSSPSALMAINLESPKRMLHRIDDESADSGPSAAAVRMKPPARPRSYIQILEDFQEHGHGDGLHSASPSTSHFSIRAAEDTSFVLDERDEDLTTEDMHGELRHSHSRGGSSLPPTPRKENTARRHKRFSLPAVALQTNLVTARPNLVGEGNSRRFSLVLGRGGALGQSSNVERSNKAHPGEGLAAGKLSELLGRVRGP